MRFFKKPSILIKFAIIFILVIVFMECRNMGIQAKSIISGSMEPQYPVGSLIFLKNASSGEIKKGDVITYQMGTNMYVTHRVESVHREDGTFTTKGDANNVVDPSAVTSEMIEGKVIGYIPYLGYLSMYLNTSAGKMVFLIGIIAFITICVLTNIVKKLCRDDIDNTGQLERR